MFERNGAILDEGDGLPSSFIDIMMLRPAVRTSVMPAWNFRSSTSTTPPHLGAALIPGDAEIAEQFAKLFQSAQISFQSASANSTNKIASGSPQRNASTVGLNMAMSSGEPEHGAVDQLDRDRPERDDVLRRLHRLVKAAEMAGPPSTSTSARRTGSISRASAGPEPIS